MAGPLVATVSSSLPFHDPLIPFFFSIYFWPKQRKDGLQAGRIPAIMTVASAGAPHRPLSQHRKGDPRIYGGRGVRTGFPTVHLGPPIDPNFSIFHQTVGADEKRGDHSAESGRISGSRFYFVLVARSGQLGAQARNLRNLGWMARFWLWRPSLGRRANGGWEFQKIGSCMAFQGSEQGQQKAIGLRTRLDLQTSGFVRDASGSGSSDSFVPGPWRHALFDGLSTLYGRDFGLASYGGSKILSLPDVP